MKNKVFTFVIGVLVGAIIASSGFLIFGGNKDKSNKRDGDQSKFRDANMTSQSGFQRNKGDLDKNKIDTNTAPEKTAE